MARGFDLNLGHHTAVRRRRPGGPFVAVLCVANRKSSKAGPMTLAVCAFDRVCPDVSRTLVITYFALNLVQLTYGNGNFDS